ncbi:MAG: DUF3488 domain-containing protein, partial [Pseudomonadota bacterium]
MLFSVAHKVASYLTTLAAVSVILLSPEISRLAAGLTLVGIAASWFVEHTHRPMSRWTIAWNISTIIFLGYQVFAVQQGQSIIVAGMHFLLFVLVNKLFNRRTAKDYQQIYVVSFLILVAATTLNTSLSYAFCFALFVIFTVYSLILLHLRKEMEGNCLLKHSDADKSQRVDVNRILNSRRIVGRSFLAGTSLFSLGILICTAILFFIFPRVGFGLFGQPREMGIAMVGFSERVELGHHGTVRDNPTVVMRVVTRSEEKQSTILWRGAAFDQYENGVWRHSNPFLGVTQSVYRVGDLYHMNYAPNIPNQLTNEYVKNNLFWHEIFLDPIDSEILFAADRPVAIDVPKVRHRQPFFPQRGPMGEIRSNKKRNVRVHYVAYSQRKRPSTKLLEEANIISDPRLNGFL